MELFDEVYAYVRMIECIWELIVKMIEELKNIMFMCAYFIKDKKSGMIPVEKIP